MIVHHIDLSSLKSVREFAAIINKNEKKIDILVHNAGYSNYLKKAVSADGIEMTMATNHYGLRDAFQFFQCFLEQNFTFKVLFS